MRRGNGINGDLIAIGLGLLLSLGCPGSAWAFSGGPGDGLTNAPGEGNCTACHGDFPLNSGTGSLTITGLPSMYTPETVYSIEVVLADPEAMRWGFELTILDGSDQFAGNLAPVDGNTQVSTGGPFGRTYVKHTLDGTQFGQADQGSWQFDWTAPAAGAGDVTIYMTGNAANGNFATSGDRIYATFLPWPEEPTTAVYAPEPIARLHPNYPNPFNPRTVVSFTLDKPTQVELAVYDLRGTRVQTLHAGQTPTGTHAYVWDGMDAQGKPQASGVYLARIVDGSGRLLHDPVKMTLTR